MPKRTQAPKVSQEIPKTKAIVKGRKFNIVEEGKYIQTIKQYIQSIFVAKNNKFKGTTFATIKEQLIEKFETPQCPDLFKNYGHRFDQFVRDLQRNSVQKYTTQQLIGTDGKKKEFKLVSELQFSEATRAIIKHVMTKELETENDYASSPECVERGKLLCMTDLKQSIDVVTKIDRENKVLRDKNIALLKENQKLREEFISQRNSNLVRSIQQGEERLDYLLTKERNKILEQTNIDLRADNNNLICILDEKDALFAPAQEQIDHFRVTIGAFIQHTTDLSIQTHPVFGLWQGQTISAIIDRLQHAVEDFRAYYCIQELAEMTDVNNEDTEPIQASGFDRSSLQVSNEREDPDVNSLPPPNLSRFRAQL